ncbi:MAG: hypothetical protein IJC84_02815 [Clostridia bacterium]|nr:hypothetical protein [Clostridia bacterium]
MELLAGVFFLIMICIGSVYDDGAIPKEPLEGMFKNGFLRFGYWSSVIFMVNGVLGFSLVRFGEREFQGLLYKKVKRISPYVAALLLCSPIFLLAILPIFGDDVMWLSILVIWFVLALVSLFLFLFLCIGTMIERKRAKSSSTEPTP